MTAELVRREAAPTGAAFRRRTPLAWLTAKLDARNEARLWHWQAQSLAATWRQACAGAEVCQRIDTVSGPTLRTPRVASVLPGPPVTLMVELMPGQDPDQLFAAAEHIARTLGCDRLRFTRRSHRWYRVELHHGEPLAARFELPQPSHCAQSVYESVLFGVDEDGQVLGESWAHTSHLVVQGETRSGKSTFVYALLAQLAGCPDALITGTDPSGLTLGRAWNGTAHRQWQTAAACDLNDYTDQLDHLAAEMDRRLATLPPRVDQLTQAFTPRLPLIVVVLEEHPNLRRRFHSEPKLLARLDAAVGRLIAEGHKVGIRVVLIAQRADAKMIGGSGGFDRDNLATGVSFRTGIEGIRMLHEDAPPEVISEHATAGAGVALLTAPGRPLSRIRGPYLHGPYSEYCDRITAATARLRASGG